jgi:isopenicillin-N epimerase
MFGRHFLREWPLDPAAIYLNHGTVGVTPLRVLAAQQAIRDGIERHPSRFLLRELTATTFGRRRSHEPRLRAAAASVAAFLGGRADDLVFVDNATSGINAVLRSFPLQPGDEVLVTDLGYGGILRAATFATRERGATLRTVTMPYPFRADALADAYVEAVGPRTRLAIVDHVCAESAIVFPLAEVAARLRAKGVAVLADGAHAPGSIAFDLPSLGVDWYVGNLHKWAWVPRSSGILWAHPERQAGLHPPVISWALDQGFTAEFDMLGTRDASAHLAAPAAIALFHEWGLDAIRAYNHALAWNGAHRLAERWGTEFDTPEALVGSMATVILPETLGTTRDEALALRDALLFEDGIEVQMHAYRGRIHARISAQIYNDLTDVDRLGEAVERRALLSVNSAES